MENKYSTLSLPMFHITGKNDAEQHWFTCKSIWSIKRIAYEATKIMHLETTFRDRDLTWYMKYKYTTPAAQERSLTKIK
jgi:hypothetical protein